MNFTITLPASGIKKAYLLGILLVFISFRSYGQSCDCPTLDDCGPCEGGLTSLTVEYTGGQLLGGISAKDGNNVSLTGSLLGNTITFYSDGYPNVPFGGGSVTVTATTVLILPLSSVNINTTCADPIYQGTIYEDEDFTILGGESLLGGTLCCSEADMPTNPPAISGCPADIVVAADASCQAVASWTPPTANNTNCGDSSPALITSDYSPGATFNLGTTTVTYTATDDYGNTNTCSFNVTVNDETAPVFTGCPTSDIMVPADGSCEASVTWVAPTVSDCSAVTVTPPLYSSGDTFPIGTTTVTYTATDEFSNTSTCSFDVIVQDTTKPTITCPGDQMLSVDINCVATLPDYTDDAIASDNCSLTVTQSPEAGLDLSPGVTTVTLTATDGAENTATCTFDVTVEDKIPPVISGCPANITMTSDAGGACKRVISWTPPTESDNCSVTTFTSTHTPGDEFEIGTTTVTYTAKDAAGNITTCSFDVTVNDETAPVFTGCPSTIVVPADGSCEASVTWVAPTVSDCSAVTVTPPSHSSGDTFPIGTTTVTYTATDEFNNTSMCSFDVTVKDTTKPTITCHVDKFISADATCGTLLPDYTGATTNDNCSSITLTQFPEVGTPLGLGTITVVLTATDEGGNIGTCEFDVTVEDTTKPTITCPGDKTILVDAACDAVLPDYTTEATAADNCSVTVTQDPPSNTSLNIGTTAVTLTATDPTGNRTTCTFDVIVADTIKPTITCPGDKTILVDAACGAILPDYTTEATAADNCSVSVTQDPPIDTPLNIGTTAVTLTATDPAGNQATCTFDVIVADTIKPTITCPGDKNISVDATCGAILPDYTTEATAADNCSVTVTQDPPIDTPLNIGTTAVTLTATDPAGNQATCTFDVIVADTTKPTITCPGDKNISVDATCGAILPDYTTEATAADNCSVSVTQDPPIDTPLNIGTTAVTLTATDPAGNQATCTFDVIVADTTKPTITCPGDKNISVDATCGAILPDYTTAATAADNCSVTVTQDPAIDTPLNIGTTAVTLTATDPAGNQATCTFDVIVADTTKPTITCPGDKNISVDATCGAVLPDYTTAATAADNCSVTVTQDPAIDTPLNIGTTTVTLTATDPAGNQATCTFDVIVADTTKPTITCPGDKNISVDAACDAVLPDYTTAATAADNCSVTVTQDPAIDTPLNIGTTTVTLTATDPAGNQATCTFDVIVADTTKPTITCPGNKNISVDAACGAILPDYTTAATAADNCSVTVTQDPAIDTPLNIGTTAVTLTATDPAGNQATCTFDVIVADTTKPTITCPGDKNISVDATCGAVLPDYTTAATAADNCSVTVTQDPPIDTPLNIGTTAVTLTATDPAGNQATCTFDVFVADTTKPTITCLDDKTISADAACGAVLPDYTTEATAWDNCSVTVSQKPLIGKPLKIGATTVTLTATDPAGNEVTCSFDVIVEDTTKPVLNCPSDKIISADAACGTSLPDYTAEATAADNCSITVTQEPPMNTALIIGITAVTLTATDPAGNQVTCTFDVIVEDTTNPTISCPADKTVSADGSCDAVLPDYTSEATAADNCPVTVTQEPPINSPLRIGTTTVTLTAMDPAGNTAMCSFDVTVEDTSNPTVSCPTDRTISTDASCEITLPDYRDLATASDNCSSPTILQSPLVGTPLPKGITTVTLTATDAVGNEEICTFNVNVVDQTAPVISGGPSDIYISLSSFECSRAVSWEEPTVTGNCKAMTSNYKPGHSFPPGTTTVTYTASDDFNNTITSSFDVIVEDKIKPQIWGCRPATVIEVTADSSCEAIVSWESLSASDNCNFTLTSNFRPGDAFPMGTTDVIYTATDDSGNKTTCTFKVKVKDRTAPVVSGCIISPITATAVSGSCYATVNWTAPSAVDNCEVITTSSHNPGDAFPIGTTIVTYTFSDNSDNISTCSFNVVVEGVIQNDGPPVILRCPGDITAEADASGQVAVDWFAPTATASCGEPVLTSSHSPGDLFPVGTTNVQYVATDFAGRTSSCSFDIIVSYEDLEFDIAKVITPDGDGINDAWVLSNIERFSDNKVVIVDRWGSVVFSASGYNNENVVWKGMNRNGALVPTGTYFYTISVRFMTEVAEKVGFIEVIR